MAGSKEALAKKLGLLSSFRMRGHSRCRVPVFGSFVHSITLARHREAPTCT